MPRLPPLRFPPLLFRPLRSPPPRFPLEVSLPQTAKPNRRIAPPTRFVALPTAQVRAVRDRLVALPDALRPKPPEYSRTQLGECSPMQGPAQPLPEPLGQSRQ